MTAEPLTPLSVEQKLRQLFNDLTRAQAALVAQARDLEVNTKHELGRARRRALLSGKAPKVARGGHTTAERDAWVDDQATSSSPTTGPWLPASPPWTTRGCSGTRRKSSAALAPQSARPTN